MMLYFLYSVSLPILLEMRKYTESQLEQLKYNKQDMEYFDGVYEPDVRARLEILNYKISQNHSRYYNYDYDPNISNITFTEES